jgi:small subunit ribosomal protein S6
MNKYELVYIITPDVDEEGRKALNERVNELIARNGGEVTKVEDWGKRRLAYAIDYKTEGWYVLVTLKAPAELPREVQRNLRNMDSIIRYLVVKLEEKRSNVKPKAARPVVVEETEAKAEEVAAEAVDTDAE